MKALIENSILSDFIKSRPQQIPFGSEADNDNWNSFWKFIKMEADLILHSNVELNPEEHFYITQLHSGRMGTGISKKDEPLVITDNETDVFLPYSFYCLDTSKQEEKEKYEKEYGCLIAFQDDYKDKWKMLKLSDLLASRSVRKEAYIKNCELKSWAEIGDYLTKFTDVVIVDNYIFSNTDLIPSNLEKILIELSKATPVKFNLTIYTFEGVENLKKGIYKINGPMCKRQIESIISNNNINCEYELVIADRKVKEHDRGIFTNYLQIKSGDSFNYFNSNGQVLTKGTDIDFKSMADPNARATAQNVLFSINKNIKELRNSKSLTPKTFGYCNNRLLKQF